MSSSKGQRQVDFLKQVFAAGGTIAKASFSIERFSARAGAFARPGAFPYDVG